MQCHHEEDDNERSPMAITFGAVAAIGAVMGSLITIAIAYALGRW